MQSTTTERLNNNKYWKSLSSESDTWQQAKSGTIPSEQNIMSHCVQAIQTLDSLFNIESWIYICKMWITGYRIKTSVTINCLPTPVQLYNPIFYHANPEFRNWKHHTETPIVWEILDNFLIHVIFIRLFICNIFTIIQILISLISRTNLPKFFFHGFAFCSFIKAFLFFFFFAGGGGQPGGLGSCLMPDEVSWVDENCFSSYCYLQCLKKFLSHSRYSELAE